MSPLLRKLEVFVEFTAEERMVLQSLSEGAQAVPSGRDLIHEGERPDKVFLLLEGWAYRYKILADGRRQIMAFLIPGDLCDIHIFLLKKMDHCIGLLSAATVAAIPAATMLEIMDRYPRIQRAMWWSTLVDEAVLREWLVNLGQREALARIGHLICEMRVRMMAVGLVDGGSFSLLLTQAELGDTMGLTPVSVNRALQRLRAEGLITLAQRHIMVHDPERLAELSGFEPNYLHLEPQTPVRLGLKE